MKKIILDRFGNSDLTFTGELVFSNEKEPTSKKPYHHHALYVTEDGLYVAQVVFHSNEYRAKTMVMPRRASHVHVGESLLDVLVYWRCFNHRKYFVVPPGVRKKDAHIIFENQYAMSLDEAVRTIEINQTTTRIARSLQTARANPRDVYQTLRVFYELAEHDQAAIYQTMMEDKDDTRLTELYQTGPRLDEYEYEALLEERERREVRIEKICDVLFGDNVIEGSGW